MRGDQGIIDQCKNFVLLRMTQMRGVNIGLFEFDYDYTWMSFFLDGEGRVITRYGSRDSKSADSHNTSAGLLNTMKEVLAVHKVESAKPQKAYKMPRQAPTDIPAYTKLYPSTCGRCHMLNEAKWEQQRNEGKMKDGAFFFFPLPENIGINLDKTRGNLVKDVAAKSLAEKAGVFENDIIRSANSVRVMTPADLQFALNKLPSKSTLTLEIERKGRVVEVPVELSGN